MTQRHDVRRAVEQLTRTPESIRICFVGDSFVNGVGDPDCLGWAGRVCREAWREGHDVTYYNLGVRRDTTADIARRWYDEISPRLPGEFGRRLVFSFGVNGTTLEDGASRVDFATSRENAWSILSAARQFAPTLMVGPPPTADEEQNTRLAAYAAAYHVICAGLDVPYLDVFNPLHASEVWMSEVADGDGSHPRAAGYTLLASLVLAWLAWRTWFT